MHSLVWLTATAPIQTSVTALEVSNQGPSIGRLLISLLFIIALILLLAWLWRRAPSLRLAQGPIQIQASLSVGTREKLILVKAGEQQLLIGVTAHQLTHLHTFDGEVPIDTSSQALGFKDILKKVSKGEHA